MGIAAANGNLAIGGIPDWVTWVSFYATLAGLFVSFFGLIATYLQAKAAKDAAKNAIAALQNRNLYGTLSSAIGHINLIKEFVSNNELVAARALFYYCTRDVKDVFHNLNISSAPSGSPDNFEIILDEISDGLEQENLTASRKATIGRSLRKISSLMSTDEAKRKWQTR